MPAVSVLMYVKNGMPYFERAIQSVINQTLSDIEVLVIDGGSTDGMVELVQNYASRDERIRLLSCEIGSAGAQFNMGLREAKGEYIGIVESDDYVLPDMYEKEYLCAKEHNCDILRADNYIFFDLNDEEVIMRTSITNKLEHYGRVMCADDEADKVFVRGSYWSGIYKREFLLANNILQHETKGAAYQDAGFSFSTFALAKSVYFMKDAFYCYRKDNLLSSCNSPRSMNLVETEYRLLKEELKQRGVWEKYKSYFYSWKIRSDRWFYDNLQEGDKEKYITNAYDNIYTDLQECDILDCQWNRKERAFIEAMKASLDVAIQYLAKEDKCWKQSSELLMRLNNDKKIYIFGAGNLGEIIHKYLVTKGLLLEAYLDNDSRMWGKEKNGVRIMAPQDAIKAQDAIVIVCSENYAVEIVDQLRRADIDEDRIIICNDIDACVKFFMKAKESVV